MYLYCTYHLNLNVKFRVTIFRVIGTLVGSVDKQCVEVMKEIQLCHLFITNYSSFVEPDALIRTVETLQFDFDPIIGHHLDFFFYKS